MSEFIALRCAALDLYKPKKNSLEYAELGLEYVIEKVKQPSPDPVLRLVCLGPML